MQGLDSDHTKSCAYQGLAVSYTQESLKQGNQGDQVPYTYSCTEFNPEILLGEDYNSHISSVELKSTTQSKWGGRQVVLLQFPISVIPRNILNNFGIYLEPGICASFILYKSHIYFPRNIFHSFWLLLC